MKIRAFFYVFVENCAVFFKPYKSYKFLSLRISVETLCESLWNIFLPYKSHKLFSL